jgi:hypothetical protein
MTIIQPKLIEFDNAYRGLVARINTLRNASYNTALQNYRSAYRAYYAAVRAQAQSNSTLNTRLSTYRAAYRAYRAKVATLTDHGGNSEPNEYTALKTAHTQLDQTLKSITALSTPYNTLRTAFNAVDAQIKALAASETAETGTINSFVQNLRTLQAELEQFLRIPIPPVSFTLQFSGARNRANPAPLNGATLANDVAIFVQEDPAIDIVAFYLNDSTFTNAPFRIEQSAPWDFNAADNSGAILFNTRTLPNGNHTISIRVTTFSGTIYEGAATFTVANQIGPSTGGLGLVRPANVARPTLAADHIVVEIRSDGYYIDGTRRGTDYNINGTSITGSSTRDFHIIGVETATGPLNVVNMRRVIIEKVHVRIARPIDQDYPGTFKDRTFEPYARQHRLGNLSGISERAHVEGCWFDGTNNNAVEGVQVTIDGLLTVVYTRTEGVRSLEFDNNCGSCVDSNNDGRPESGGGCKTHPDLWQIMRAKLGVRFFHCTNGYSTFQGWFIGPRNGGTIGDIEVENMYVHAVARQGIIIERNDVTGTVKKWRNVWWSYNDGPATLKYASCYSNAATGIGYDNANSSGFVNAPRPKTSGTDTIGAYLEWNNGSPTIPNGTRTYLGEYPGGDPVPGDRVGLNYNVNYFEGTPTTNTRPPVFNLPTISGGRTYVMSNTNRSYDGLVETGSRFNDVEISANEILTGRVDISNARNVIIRNLHIRIDRARISLSELNAIPNTCSGATQANNNARQYLGINCKNLSGKIVFIGCHVDGRNGNLLEGIFTYAPDLTKSQAEAAQFVFINCLIGPHNVDPNVKWPNDTSLNSCGFGGLADRPKENKDDSIEGMHGSYYLWGVTSLRSGFQGWYFSGYNANNPIGEVQIYHSNNNQTHRQAIAASGIQRTTPPPVFTVFQNVWVFHDVTFCRSTADDAPYMYDGKPDTFGTKTNGYVIWPAGRNPMVAAGLRIERGVPPNGDFAKPEKVGLNYDDNDPVWQFS